MAASTVPLTLHLHGCDRPDLPEIARTPPSIVRTGPVSGGGKVVFGSVRNAIAEAWYIDI